MRTLFALVLALAPLASIGACTGSNAATAAATKPTSPANGAGDYNASPGGPHESPVIPTASGEPNASGDCPPKCSDDGSWTGCGLKKPRGSNCKGCAPKCKKTAKEEGWYDCSGMMIAERKCD
jgi:hypothetical protein